MHFTHQRTQHNREAAVQIASQVVVVVVEPLGVDENIRVSVRGVNWILWLLSMDSRHIE